MTSLTPGGWVTITVNVKNEGGVADVMTVQIGLPTNPSLSDVQILPTDISAGAVYYPAGSTLAAGYHQYTVTSKYAIVEAAYQNWPAGYEGTFSIKVKVPDKDTFTFDVKSVARSGSTWISDPASGMVDQQDEYVESYLILKRFTATVVGGGTTEVPISITNYARYPNRMTQPSMVVTSFVVGYGGFNGTIEALNLPLTISPGTTGTLRIKVSPSSACATGTYDISYQVLGTP